MPLIPTDGIQSFGYPRSATHTHQGVDIVASEGTPVHALERSSITHIAPDLEPGFSGYGGHVVLHGPSGHWLYAHLSGVALLKPGDVVEAGQQIGAVGRTCYSTEHPDALCDGAHLHLELSVNTYPQDSEAPRLDPVPRLQQLGGLAALFGDEARFVRPRRPAGWVLVGGMLAGGLALAVVWRRGK